MTDQELIRELNKGKLLPFYYFWGPEKWLMDEALKKVEEKALDPGTRDFNREVLDGEEESPETILASLQVFPVRSPRRLIIIRKADGMGKKNPDPFIQYFQNPNPQTCAVFLGEKADQRTKFFQSLEKKGAIVSFFPPYEKDLHRWVRTQAEQLGHSISDEAIALLVERVGPSLREIQMELQKLSLRPERGKRIGEEDILAMTEDARSENPFDLSRAVGRLDFREALHLLRKNLQQGEPPVLLFSLLTRHLRLIRRARDLLSQGFSKKEVEGRLRILPRRAQDFWKQVDRFPPPLLEGLWPLSLKADRMLKFSRSDKGLILEEYVLSLLLNSGGAPFPVKEDPALKEPRD